MHSGDYMTVKTIRLVLLAFLALPFFTQKTVALGPDDPISDYFKTGCKDGAKEIIKATIKKPYEDLFLDPYILRPIKKRLGMLKSYDRAKNLDTLLKKAQVAQELKNAGLPAKELAEITKQLFEEYKKMVDDSSKK